MAEPVYILGAGRTDFKRNIKKEGKTIRHIILNAAQAAIADAGIEPQDIQAGIVENFSSGLFTRQLHLGAFLVEVDPRAVCAMWCWSLALNSRKPWPRPRARTC